MRTININLIGEYGRKNTANPFAGLLSKLDGVSPKVRKQCLIMAGGSTGIFVLSILLWIGVCASELKMESDLVTLNKQGETLNLQVQTLSNLITENENKKKVLELKKIAKTKIDELFINWYSTLGEIGSITPKGIKLTGISQNQNSYNQDDDGSKSIEIKGLISSLDSNALDLIAYMTLNINENLPESALLKEATIESVDFDKEQNVYAFTISAKIKPQATEESKSTSQTDKSTSVEQ